MLPEIIARFGCTTRQEVRALKYKELETGVMARALVHARVPFRRVKSHSVLVPDWVFLLLSKFEEQFGTEVGSTMAAQALVRLTQRPGGAAVLDAMVRMGGWDAVFELGVP